MELISMVFQQSRQAIVITDSQGTILRVNPSFTVVTGYTAEEAVGQTPRILKSQRHDGAFYQGFWKSLLADGEWTGRIWNRKKTGEGYASHLRVHAIRDNLGEIKYFVGISEDVTNTMLALDGGGQPDNIDILTELPNRHLFREKFGYALQRAQSSQGKAALLLVDLDDFRRINGLLGHHAADALLQKVARRLVRALGRMDMVARLGQDEFAIGLTDIKELTDVRKTAADLLETIAKPTFQDGTQVTLEASIGAAIFPDDGTTVDKLFQKADIAMFRAKTGGKKQYQFFDAVMAEQLNRRFALISELRNAVPGELVLFYQPQTAISSGRIIGAEALIRWRHPQHGLIGPDLFLPVAEETGLIREIGLWVIETACRQAAYWLHTAGQAVRIAVNVSANQLLQPNFGETVLQIIRRFGLPPALLELELTETTVMIYHEEAARLFHDLKSEGIHIALDDFGTGYSSLAYLKQLPLSGLKIDRSFFRNIPDSQDDMELVRMILEIAHSLGLRAVAEGIETPAQLAFLERIGCDEYQGYLMAKPMPPEELEHFLRQRHRTSASNPECSVTACAP